MSVAIFALGLIAGAAFAVACALAVLLFMLAEGAAIVDRDLQAEDESCFEAFTTRAGTFDVLHHGFPYPQAEA